MDKKHLDVEEESQESFESHLTAGPCSWAWFLALVDTIKLTVVRADGSGHPVGQAAQRVLHAF